MLTFHYFSQFSQLPFSRNWNYSTGGPLLDREVICAKLLRLMRSRHLRMLYIPSARGCTKIKDLISILFVHQWNLLWQLPNLAGEYCHAFVWLFWQCYYAFNSLSLKMDHKQIKYSRFLFFFNTEANESHCYAERF